MTRTSIYVAVLLAVAGCGKDAKSAGPAFVGGWVVDVDATAAGHAAGLISRTTVEGPADEVEMFHGMVREQALEMVRGEYEGARLEVAADRTFRFTHGAGGVTVEEGGWEVRGGDVVLRFERSGGVPRSEGARMRRFAADARDRLTLVWEGAVSDAGGAISAIEMVRAAAPRR